MKWSVLCVAIQATAVASSLAAAQSGGDMKMSQPHVSAVAYSGCVEAGSAAGTFTLTHVAAVNGMSKDSMAKAGTMKAETMKPDTMSMGGMSHDAMAPSTLSLTAKSSIDLKKHVGQKVSITGIPVPGQMDAAGKDIASLSVTSVKTLAKSCS